MVFRVTFDPGGRPIRHLCGTQHTITHSEAEASIPRVSQRMHPDDATTPSTSKHERIKTRATTDDQQQRTGRETPPCIPIRRRLQFSPERRMLFDRDEGLAHAIAGLRHLELQGFECLTAFRHKKRQAIRCSSEGRDPRDGCGLRDGDGTGPHRTPSRKA